MKRPSNSFRIWAVAIALLLILAVAILRPDLQTATSPASANSLASDASATAAVGETMPSVPARASVQSQEEEAIPQPLENEFQKRLLDQAVTLATTEAQDLRRPTLRIKSRLLRTPFKYPHLRSDETWDETPAGLRLVRRELYVADHVMVRFPETMSPLDVTAWCDIHGFQVRNRLKTDNVHLVATKTATLDSTIQLLETIRKSFAPEDGGVLAERDSLVFPTVSPNDPSYSQLWGLHNTGQTAGTPDADIDAPEAWEFSTGSADVVVAVIDTGVDQNHNDLRDNIWTNTAEIAGNGIDDDGNGFIDDRQGWDFYADDNVAFDEQGHGSHCSGTIGGTGNNGVGVAGVCWDVSIVPIRFLGPFGGSTSDGIDSINYSTTIGVDLSSNSWGGGGFSSLLEQAITRANTAGILFVAAAGNDTVNNDIFPNYPSNYSAPNIISVASTTATDSLSSFSNYGLTTVDIAAPG
ncbi:MAG: S8 family peptidase, partial [Luteolibacter sp.]